MRTSSITVFSKQATCPSAETLVSYNTLEISRGAAAHVLEHLTSCEFCSAELKLLSEHTPQVEEYRAAEIPAHLRSLAEALLGGVELSHIMSQPDISYERERLTLTDA